MTNGTLLREKYGWDRLFIILERAKAVRTRPPFDIDGYKIARCNRINHTFFVDDYEITQKFEVIA